ncbi:MAG: hypothetical protein ACYDG2_19360 [Ruminiclostridium sp.]
MEKPVSEVVFKLEHDKTMGRIAHIRLYNGMIKNRDVVYNATAIHMRRLIESEK